jgi:hypothetical protein
MQFIKIEQHKFEHALLATCFTRVSCFAYSSTLKMGVTFSPETSVDFQQTILYYKQEN